MGLIGTYKDQAEFETNQEEEETSQSTTGSASEIEVKTEEIMETLGKLKNWNVSNVDDISKEMFKDGGKDIVMELKTCFNKIIQREKIPEEWHISKALYRHIVTKHCS